MKEPGGRNKTEKGWARQILENQSHKAKSSATERRPNFETRTARGRRSLELQKARSDTKEGRQNRRGRKKGVEGIANNVLKSI